MLSRCLIAFYVFLGSCLELNSQVCTTADAYDNCWDACPVCNVEVLDGYQGTSGGFTPDGTATCLSIENSSWLAFVAAEDIVDLTLTPSNCMGSTNPDGTGLQAQVFEGCSGTPVSGCFTPGFETPMQISATGLSPGTSYYILIDGFAGSICDYTIDVNSGQGEVEVQDPDPISGSSLVCLNGTFTYFTNEVEYAEEYVWELPAGATIDGQSSPAIISASDNGFEVEVTFDGSVGDICVTPQNPCSQGGTVCFTVDEKPTDTYILDPIELCYEECELWVDGEFHCEDEYMVATLITEHGCDSIIEQELIIDESYYRYFEVELCPNECFELHGETYCDDGWYYEYLFNGSNECDSILEFRIIKDEYTLTVNTTDASCNAADGEACVEFSSFTASYFDFEWSSSPDQTLCVDNLPGGNHQVTVTDGNDCLDTLDFTIATSGSSISAGTNGSVSLCASDAPINLFDVLGGSPDNTGSWDNGLSGHLGEFDPSLLSSGTFTYTISDPVCGSVSAQVDVAVEQAFEPGQNGSVSICASSTAVINLFDYLTGNPDAGGEWSLPNLAGEGMFDPAQHSAGTFTYSAPSSNNCAFSTSEVTVSFSNGVNAGTDNSITLCSSDAPVNLFDLLGGSADNTGSWDNGLSGHLGEFDPSQNTSGTYIYTVSDPNCGSASAEIEVLIENGFNPGQDGAVSVCASSITVIDLFDYLTGNPDAGGEWSLPNLAGEGMFDPVQHSAGTFTYSAPSSNNCASSTSEITVTFIASSFAGNDTTLNICETSNSVDILSLLPSNITPQGSWTPSFSSNSSMFDPSADMPGAYTYTVGGAGCPISSSQININIGQSPQILSGQVEYCSVDLSTIDLHQYLQPNPHYGGEWNFQSQAGEGIYDPSLHSDGLYTYTYDPQNGCADVVAQVQVNAIASSVSAGIGDTTLYICSNSSSVNLFDYLEGAPDNTGTWNNGLTGYLGVFDPSQYPSGTYNYTVSDPNCGPITSEIEVIVTPLPNAGGDVVHQICSSDTQPIDLFSLIQNNPDVGGTWNLPDIMGEGVFDPTQHAFGIYTYTIEAQNGCAFQSANVALTQFNNNPGEDTSIVICDSAQSNLFLSLGGNPASGGSWSPSLSSNTSVFDPLVDLQGIYTYSVGGPDCPVQTAQVDVLLNKVSAGNDSAVSLCSSGGIVDLSDYIGVLATPGGVWTDQNGNVSAAQFDLSIHLPGLYTYTVQSNGCPSQSSSVQVQITGSPDAGVDQNLAFCSTDALVDLNTHLSASANIGGIYDGLPNGLFNPSVNTSGMYSYIVSITGCGSDTSIFTIDVHQPIYQAIDTQAVICQTAGVQNLADYLPNAPINGSWPGLSTNNDFYFDPNAFASGAYQYVIPPINTCPSITSTVDVVVLDSLDAGADTSVTFCNSFNQIGLFDYSSGADASGIWFGPSTLVNGTFDPSVHLAGTYMYVLPSQNGCEADTALFMVSIEDSLHAGISSSQQFCSDDQAVDLFSLLGGAAQSSGIWSPLPASQTSLFDPSIDTSMTYTYTLSSNGVCPPKSANVSVVVNQQGHPGENSTLNICVFDSALLMQDYILGNPDTGGYWLPLLDSGIFDPQVHPSGVYTYVVEGEGACETVISEHSITVDQPVSANIEPIASVCQNTNEIALSSSSLGLGYWTGSGISDSLYGIFTPSGLSAGVYPIVFHYFSACSTPEFYDIEVIEAPSAEFYVSDSIGCVPYSVNMFPYLADSTIAYSWFYNGEMSTSQPSFMLEVDQAGTSEVQLIAQNAFCSDTSQAIILQGVNPPIADFYFTPFSPTVESPEVLFENASEHANSYVWTINNDSLFDRDISYVFDSLAADTYQVCLKALNVASCYDVLCKEVFVQGVFNFYVPNAFTPNGNSDNEFFHPKMYGEAPSNYTFEIFDRWGAQMFSSTNPSEKWDGSFQNNPVPQGTYLWEISLYDNAHFEWRTYNGFVVLIR